MTMERSGGGRPGGRQPLDDAPLTLIYLDVDDEITSAAARIRAAGAADIALVLPFGSRLATSRINFRLLAREAADRGKSIEIVCADPSARALAVAAGLPTHPSVAAFEAHRAGEHPPDDASRGDPAAAADAATADTAEPVADDAADTRTRVLPVPRDRATRVPLVGPPRPPIRTGLAIGLVLALVVAVVGGGLLALEFLPTATITLHPRSQAIGPIELSIEARADVAAPDPATLTIPAERFTFALEASQSFPATGVRIEEVKATGTVTFSNFDNGRGVVIPAGTVVRTDSKIEFQTLAEVTLPRAQQDFFPPFSTHPSTSSVGIEAVLPGPKGNVGNNTIVNVVGGGRNLFVNNADPTTGGARNELPEVSAEDVEAAQAAIVAALITDLDSRVAAGEGVPPAVTLFPETRSAGTPEFTVDPESLVGTEAEQFDLGATAEGTALGVDPGPVNAVAITRLEERVTDGWSIDPASIVADVGAPSVIGEAIVFPATVQATQVRDVDQAELLRRIMGLGLPAARALLDDYGDVELDVWPDWVTTIPSRADRVTLTLGEPRPSAAP